MFSIPIRSSINKNIIKHSIKPRTIFSHNLISQQQQLLPQSSPTSENLAFLLENPCAEVNTLKKLHACIFTHGFQNNIFLGSKLVNAYVQFDLLRESKWVFDRIINDKLSLWNSIFVGYFRTGHFYEVLLKYLCLRKRNIGLDSCGLTFCLKSCVELGDFGFGKSVHADCVKFGFCADRYVGSSLVGLYKKNGDIDDAYKVFDEINERDVVVYTSLITACAQTGDWRAYGAFIVASDMQKEDFDPNRVTLVSLLQAAAQVEALNEGRSVHGYAIRRSIGCCNDVFETSLMDMYAKCGANKMAANIFGKSSTSSVGCWNAAIGGNLQSGQPFQALELFSLMMKHNHASPDLITLANVVLCCANLKYLREGKSVHCYIIRAGFQLDQVVTTSLIDFYAKCHSITQAKTLFCLMKERDLISYNVMMAGFLLHELAHEAREVFYEMVEAGITPNIGTVLSLLFVSSIYREITQVESVHGYVLKQGFDLNVEISNQLIHMYAKCGSIEHIYKVFSRMRYKDLVSWTSLMTGYVVNGHAEAAITLFRLMQREKLQADSISLISLLQASAQIGCLSFAKEIHCQMYRSHFEGDVSFTNSLVTTYAKCGKIDTVQALFENRVRDCRTSWNTIIGAYAMHGDCVEVLQLFDQMKEKFLPDEVTFTSVLSLCSHSGLVEEGLCVFISMIEDYSIRPCEEHYNCIVDLISRAGQIEEANEFLKCTPSNENAAALSSMLAACRVHNHAEMGEVIRRLILDIKPKNSSAYALASNLCAENGKWDEVVQIRAIPKERGLKWNAGYSLMEATM